MEGGLLRTPALLRPGKGVALRRRSGQVECGRSGARHLNQCCMQSRRPWSQRLRWSRRSTAQHGAKVDGESRRPSAFPAESLEPISCSPTAVGVTVAVQSHVQVQARKAMERGKQQEASKSLATSPRLAAATRCGAKGPSIVGEGVKTCPLAWGRARGERRSPSAAHASSGWGRSIPADRLDISSSTAGAQRVAVASRCFSPRSTRRVSHVGAGASEL